MEWKRDASAINLRKCVEFSIMPLLRLPDEIDLDALKKVIQLIHTDTFKPGIIRKHIKYW